jgi:hypothetical protein
LTAPAAAASFRIVWKPMDFSLVSPNSGVSRRCPQHSGDEQNHRDRESEAHGSMIIPPDAQR